MNNQSFPYDFGHVSSALRRLQESSVGEPCRLGPPSQSELEEALGERLKSCRLYTKNFRSRIYRLEFPDGRLAMAKQVVIGSPGMLRYEFDQIRQLANLKIPGLRMPQSLGLLPSRQIYVTEFVSGAPIPNLFRNRSRRPDLIPACELAGRVIARIHAAWTDEVCSMPADRLQEDFAIASWELSFHEEEVLEAALQLVRPFQVSVGRVYYDYKPMNLLFENGEIALLDPPDRLRRCAHLWDFASFRASMRRHFWSSFLQQPLARKRRIIRQSLIAFERGYLPSIAPCDQNRSLFVLAVMLFELQRTAVLITLQRGKVALAREKRPIAGHRNFGNPIALRLTLPLLEIEKRWLFRQLARELYQSALTVLLFSFWSCLDL